MHYNSASLDSEVTCSNFQIMGFIMERESSSNVSWGLKEGEYRTPKDSSQNAKYTPQKQPYRRTRKTGKKTGCLSSTAVVMLLWWVFRDVGDIGWDREEEGGGIGTVSSGRLSSMWNLAFLSLLPYKLACKPSELHWLQQDQVTLLNEGSHWRVFWWYVCTIH